MPEHDNGPRKPKGGAHKPSSFADDWPDAPPVATETGPDAGAPPDRQRIARAMARAGLCSRRDAEAWILDGRVSVNGEVLTSPARDVGPEDRVEIDGQPLPEAEKTRLFLFHKPRGLVTSDHDPEGRETVTDYLRENWPKGPRVVTIGRLDINTEGLLLLTNDGGLARQLELPKTGWLRRYRVRANGETDQAKLDALAAGITIDGIDYAGIEAKLDRTQGANCWLTMGLREGKNREIKRVLEHLGLEVNRLIRLSFGPFQLLDLEEGAVEEVRTRVLKDQLGAALAVEAGVDFGEEPAASTPIKEGRERVTLTKAPSTPRAPRERSDRAARAPDRPDRRGGDRPQRRRDAPAAMPARDDRPEGRPRRHVSSLRTQRAEDERSGPRKRVERSDTRDRNDRTVTVERKVSARPAVRLSPSAEGKRARVARSGGQRRGTEDGAERATGRVPSRSRDDRAPRTERSAPTGERRGRSFGTDKTRDAEGGRSDRPRQAATRAPRRDDEGGRRNAPSAGKPSSAPRREPRDGFSRGEGRASRGDGAPAKSSAGRGRPAGRSGSASGGKPAGRSSSGGKSPNGGPNRGGPPRGGSGRGGTGRGKR